MLSTLSFDDGDYAKALKCSRGVYQLGLLRGLYEWNGNDIRGQGQNWSWKYECSRKNLLTRLDKNNVKCVFFVMPWFILKPILLIGITTSIPTSDNTRKYFMAALKNSSVRDALKATIAREIMFNGASSYTQTLDVKHAHLKPRGKHYHLDWSRIKNGKATNNRPESIFSGN